MDIGCLEKHNLSTALLENSRKHHGIAVNSHKASPLGPFPDWLSSPIAVLNGFKSQLRQNWLLLQVTEYYRTCKLARLLVQPSKNSCVHK